MGNTEARDVANGGIMSLFKHDDKKTHNESTDAAIPTPAAKHYQLLGRCINCRKEAPLYFEFGKKIAWKEIKKGCGVCGIDAGWVASE